MTAARFLALGLALLAAPAPAASPRPNILLIVADDLGWGDVGWHNPEMRTPNLDALVADGVELDQHYVMPQCTPTRVALITGRYPSRFGSHCTSASNEQAYPIGTPTLPLALRELGYATYISGKWHMGSKPEWGPNHHGFDASYGFLAGAIGAFDHRYRLTLPEYTNTWHRDHELFEEEGHATDLITREAVRRIEEHGARDETDRKPFFLYVPYQAVHVPLVEERRWHNINAHIAHDDRRLFAAAVSHMDHCIGEMIDALARTGQEENTIVIFFSDNGGLMSHKGDTYPPPDPAVEDFSTNLPLRGWKTQVYEGGMRVTALVRWKGNLRPGRMTAPMHAADWMPTLLGALGSAPPADQPRDGVDMWPAISSGGDKPPAERTLYWVWGKKRNRVALRRGDWKMLRPNPREAFELYNLADDPYETTDLAAKHPEKLAELTAMFEAEKAKDKDTEE